MSRKEAIPPEVPVEDAETPTGDVTLESGAQGADLASEATSPTFEAAPEEGTEEPVAEAGAAPEAEVEAEAPEAAAEPEVEVEAEAPEAQVEAEVEVEAPEAAAEPEAEGPQETAPKSKSTARPYRPTEDYVEGDRIYHPVWDADGVVTFRDPQERIFRIPIGRVEERGRCRMIRVEFEKDVPTAGGPRREVMLIADWHGRTFEVGVPQPTREEEELLSFRPSEEERPAPRAKAPALPEIPEPEELDLEDEEEEEEEPGDEESRPLGI